MTIVVLDYAKGEVRVYTDLEIEMNEVENWLNAHDPEFKESQCSWMCSKDQIPINWMNDKGEYTHDWRML